MAHIWTRTDANDWTPQVLTGDAVTLPGQDAVLLRRVGHHPGNWALLSSAPGLRLNGAAVPLGLAILEDRDEIRVAQGAAWFSTETLAQTEPFPETATRGMCPRCKQTITSGSTSVRCPNCQLWHHQSGEFPCWTYAATCAGCAQETALDAGFRWTPEDL